MAGLSGVLLLVLSCVPVTSVQSGDYTVQLECEQDYGQEVLVTNAQTALQCSTWCSEEITCVSFQYNGTSGTCRLNSKWAKSFPTGCQDTVKYAWLNKGSWDKMGSGWCTSDPDCDGRPHEVCQGEVCKCAADHTYIAHSDQCESCASCTIYSSSFFVTPKSYLLGLNNLILQGLTVEDCHHSCLNTTSFLCISYDYSYSGECRLSDACTVSAGFDLRHHQGWEHGVRFCI